MRTTSPSTTNKMPAIHALRDCVPGTSRDGEKRDRQPASVLNRTCPMRAAGDRSDSEMLTVIKRDDQGDAAEVNPAANDIRRFTRHELRDRMRNGCWPPSER
jgi:hypothetical protein